CVTAPRKITDGTPVNAALWAGSTMLNPIADIGRPLLAGEPRYCPLVKKVSGAPLGSVVPISPCTLIGMKLIVTVELPWLRCTMPGQVANVGLPWAYSPWVTMAAPLAVTVALKDLK